jgi:predicted DsbA family dithiol-disulfide isomerase
MPPPVALTGDPDERNYKSPNFIIGSLTTITLAHDYLCPWCWIGFLHAQRLTAEFGVTFDWRGFELVPPSMAHTPAPPKPADPDAPPKPPSRFDLFVEAEGYVMPSPRPKFTRTHHALLGAEYAHALGSQAFDRYNEAVYRAFWERCEDISDLTVLQRLASDAGLDGSALVAAIEDGRYENQVVPFDDDAYRIGIRHVPTFFFNAEEKLAEAPYADLARATERFLVRSEKFRGKA